jgi:hypothetical protein
MTPIQWNTIVARMAVTSQPAGLWTPVYPYLTAGTLVRVMADPNSTWSYSGQMQVCGADGHRISFIPPQRCLTKDAQVGALICKVGGGTADVHGTIFPGGTLCTFTVPDGGGGLFMTINDEVGGFDDNSGQLYVNVAVKLAGGADA